MYDKFRQILEERQISSYKVAKETGVSQTVLSYWKHGRSNPKVDKLVKIAGYLKIPIDELIKEGN